VIVMPRNAIIADALGSHKARSSKYFWRSMCENAPLDYREVSVRDSTSSPGAILIGVLWITGDSGRQGKREKERAKEAHQPDPRSSLHVQDLPLLPTLSSPVA
jgi:hypothetical protein